MYKTKPIRGHKELRGNGVILSCSMGGAFDRPFSDNDIVLVDSVTIAIAFRHVSGCEACSKDADMPFDWLLDATTGRNPAITDYVMETAAKCPRCRRPVTEKTLVDIGES